MATCDVPGANSLHRDELAMGCWAEHEDGSLIFVESTEQGRVIYSMFDTSGDSIVEYRDSMPETGFKKAFSFQAGDSDIKWTWHDKTPFPWDRVVALGARDGVRHAHADDLLSAAEKVAQSRSLKRQDAVPEDFAHMDQVKRSKPARGIISRVQKAIQTLRS